MQTTIDPTKKEKILAFLQTQHHGVIATNSPDSSSPESALVAISETEDLEIVFGTSIKSRKYQNILKNPHVAFVVAVADDEKRISVQFEGKAIVVEGKERDVLVEGHVKKNPGSAKYLSDPDQKFFKVSPHWIRYSDFNATPLEVWEISYD